jgi:hypothetical protein
MAKSRQEEKYSIQGIKTKKSEYTTKSQLVQNLNF